MFDIKKAEIAKGVIQSQALMLFNRHSNLLLSFSTGCGKTLATLRCIDSLMQKDGLYTDKIYIILKEVAHEENWYREIKKWQYDYLLPNIEFFCYASLHKYIDDKVGVLVLDECHALSEMREDYLKTIKCDKIISLSATAGKHIKKRIESYKPPLKEFNIRLQEAIDKGILPEPKIFVAYADLDNKEAKYAFQYNKKSKIEMVTALAYYKRVQSKVDMWEKRYLEHGEDWAKTRWIQSMGNRKKMMSRIKTDSLKKLVKILDNKRFICFTGSIEQCREVGAVGAIHSKIDLKTRAYLIEDFNEGKTNHLFAVGMLRESMNLNGIEAGIIGQLDNQSGSFEQMTGRSMRAIAPEIYILVLRGTKDEDYFNKATMNISSQYIEEYVWPKE